MLMWNGTTAIEYKSEFKGSQGYSVLRIQKIYLLPERTGIDWQMLGRMHNIQLITEWACENPANCHLTLREQQKCPLLEK